MHDGEDKSKGVPVALRAFCEKYFHDPLIPVSTRRIFEEARLAGVTPWEPTKKNKQRVTHLASLSARKTSQSPTFTTSKTSGELQSADAPRKPNAGPLLTSTDRCADMTGGEFPIPERRSTSLSVLYQKRDFHIPKKLLYQKSRRERVVVIINNFFPEAEGKSATNEQRTSNLGSTEMRFKPPVDPIGRIFVSVRRFQENNYF